MKDFMHLSDTVYIADREGNKMRVTVTRTRTSLGHATITLDVNERRVLELSSDLEDYEGAARGIADLLERIAAEPCNLPAGEPS